MAANTQLRRNQREEARGDNAIGEADLLRLETRVKYLEKSLSSRDDEVAALQHELAAQRQSHSEELAATRRAADAEAFRLRSLISRLERRVAEDGGERAAMAAAAEEREREREREREQREKEQREREQRERDWEARPQLRIGTTQHASLAPSPSRPPDGGLWTSHREPWSGGLGRSVDNMDRALPHPLDLVGPTDRHHRAGSPGSPQDNWQSVRLPATSSSPDRPDVARLPAATDRNVLGMERQHPAWVRSAHPVGPQHGQALRASHDIARSSRWEEEARQEVRPDPMRSTTSSFLSASASRLDDVDSTLARIGRGTFC